MRGALKHDEIGPVISAAHKAVHRAVVNRIVTAGRIDDKSDEPMDYKVRRAAE